MSLLGINVFSHIVRLVPLLCQYVLAVGSSVFHAMFYGELAEDQDEIRIPDVEPPSFLAMLKYVDLLFVWFDGAFRISPLNRNQNQKSSRYWFTLPKYQ